MHRQVLVVCALLAAVPVVAEEQVLVDYGSPMVYLANLSDPGVDATWPGESFDDSAWPVGSYGVGYDTLGHAQQLVPTTVPEGTLSVYTRTHFHIDDAGAVERLVLGLDYDDGYLAWINGVEVARSHVPDGPSTWDMPASEHESSNGTLPFYEFVEIPPQALSELHDGDNVLAIGAWNRNSLSTDLVLVPQLLLNPTLRLTRGPFLQSGTSDGLVVRWRTSIPTGSRVAFGPAPGALSNIVEDPSPNTEHAVTLTGLAPDTAYYYSIGTLTEVLAGDGAGHFFVTAPLTGVAKPTRIWILGDSGTGNSDAMAVRDAYYAYTGDAHTDLWLMLGDNALQSGTDGEFQAMLFDIFPEMLAKSVLWPTLGNHDAASAVSITQTGPYYDIFHLPTSGEAGGLASGTEAYYSFDYGNIHFVVLDSHESDRSPGGAMLTWLETDLAATAQDWIVAYWHHPAYSKGGHDSDIDLRLIEMRENAVPILDDYGVDLTFAGHSHSYERSFLIDGHYGPSTTFTEGMKVDGGDGREGGDGAYTKAVRGPLPRSGIVHTVAGSSGKVGGGLLDHPAMFFSLRQLGSVVMDIDGSRLDVVFLDHTGAVRDSYTMIKGPDCPSDPDNDGDRDGICGDVDNCPEDANPGQEDADGDGQGDVCDPCPSDPNDDGDGDGVCTNMDNCPDDPNPLQRDLDGDGLGNECDACPTDPDNDVDVDGVCGDTDNCPGEANPLQTDSDLDGIGDACDPCPTDPLNDDDGDGVCRSVDNCPFVPNPDQTDSDGDGVGDACLNGDDDTDGVPNGADCAPWSPGLAAPPEPVGATLLLSDSSGMVQLTWQRGAQAHSFNVYKGLHSATIPISTTNMSCFGADIPSVQVHEYTGPPPGALYYYLVTAINACAESGASQDSAGIERHPLPRCPVGDSDADLDGTPNRYDNCPLMANPDLADVDQDFVGDTCDDCPLDPAKADPGYCGCGVEESYDGDGDGVPCSVDCDDTNPEIQFGCDG